MAAMLYGCRRGLNIIVLDNPPLVSDDDITKAHMLGRLSGIGAAARNTDEENMFNAGEAVECLDSHRPSRLVAHTGGDH
jgi:hypothetical protein